MKIGVISDTHDHLLRTEQAIRLLRQRGAEVLLHCGDIVSPETVALFAGTPSHFIFGNNDHRESELRSAIAQIDAVCHGDMAVLELAGKKVAMTHGHLTKIFRQLEHSGENDFFFYGHTHAAESHFSGKTFVMNPGAMIRTRRRTVALVDLITSVVEIVDIEG